MANPGRQAEDQARDGESIETAEGSDGAEAAVDDTSGSGTSAGGSSTGGSSDSETIRSGTIGETKTPPSSRRVTPPKAKTGSKRVTPPKARSEQSARYTAKGTNSTHKGPSPRWVPVLMFSLWALGLLIIILNYMTVLPGATANASGWYLIAGLVSLLAGIVVATQYR